MVGRSVEATEVLWKKMMFENFMSDGTDPASPGAGQSCEAWLKELQRLQKGFVLLIWFR
jgi:hypothetical protein